MARPRFENLEVERQEQILAAAAEEFELRGFAGASVNRILESAGLSKGVLYYYFEDKADLFATTLEQAFLRFLEAIGLPGQGQGAMQEWLEGMEAADFWEHLRAMGRDHIHLLRSDAWFVRLARRYHRLRAEPEARGASEGVMDLFRGMGRAFVDRGQALGLIRTDAPRDLLVECFVAVDEATDRWLVERADELDDEELMRLRDLTVDLLRDLLDANHQGWGN